jgi:two-component system, LuxR family, response regulator FixJ
MTQDPLVYLIDPNRTDRDCIERQLEEVNLPFRSFGDAEAFLTRLEPTRLGCVLTELKLGSLTAFQLVNHLRQRSSSLPVVLVTSYATVPVAIQAFKAGMFDLVVKPSEAFQLWDSATRAFENHGSAINNSRHRTNITNRLAHLTRQELQVMQMLLDGEPNKRIAARLKVSPRTVVFRRKSLMQKMNAKSVAELACMVHSLTGQAARDTESRTSTLLDVYVTANIYDSLERFEPTNGNSIAEISGKWNAVVKQPH